LGSGIFPTGEDYVGEGEWFTIIFDLHFYNMVIAGDIHTLFK
jgi:hypothetical protein